MNKNQKALGKGLESLLGNIPNDKKVSSAQVDAEIALIDINLIDPNPDQPRKEFNQDNLNELAQSIKENGVIVPITVNKVQGRYQIIAGERRYRASKIASLKQIPCYIRVVTEQSSMQMALIENIQREDLNSIEIALSLKALLDSSNISQQELGDKLGKSRSSIANYVRLLNLPAEVQLAIRNDQISMGHARSLINVENETDQIDIVRQIIAKGLSVRQVEQMVKSLKAIPKTIVKKAVLPQLHTQISDKLTSKLDTQITIHRSQRGKGTITISFKNDQDFERIANLLDRE